MKVMVFHSVQASGDRQDPVKILSDRVRLNRAGRKSKLRVPLQGSSHKNDERRSPITFHLVGFVGITGPSWNISQRLFPRKEGKSRTYDSSDYKHRNMGAPTTELNLGALLSTAEGWAPIRVIGESHGIRNHLDGSVAGAPFRIAGRRA